MISRKISTRYALLLLMLAGAILRFYGLAWDNYHFFNPDVRNILGAASQIGSNPNQPYNPRFFAYGSLTIYLIRIAAEIFSFHGRFFNPKSWENLLAIARLLSMILGTASIFLTYRIGKRLFGTPTGILGAAFLTFTVLHIQISHYGTVEVTLTFLLLAVTLYAIRTMQERSLRSYLLAGFFLGLALATKASAVTFFAILIAGHVAALFSKNRSETLGRLWIRFGAGIVAAIATSLMAAPYYYLDYKDVLDRLTYEKGVAIGTLDVPYTLQYHHTPAYVYQIQHLVEWSMGWPLGIAAVAAFGVLLYRLVYKPRWDIFLLLAWVVPYFLIVGGWRTKFLRYMAPMIPFLCIAAAYWLNDLRERYRGSVSGLAVRAYTVGTLIFLAWYALAFFHIYGQPNTRNIASRWIYANIPPQAKLLTEHWDDGLPIPGEGGTTPYERRELTLYDLPDNDAKIAMITERLVWGDVVIISSKRLTSSIMQVPERYPVTGLYYRLLFSGNLGYELVQTVTSRPHFLGITINDDLADDNYMNYDHPKIHIFRKTRVITPADVLAAFRTPPPGVLGLSKDDLLRVISKDDVTSLMKTGTSSEVLPRGPTLFGKNSSFWPILAAILSIEWLGWVAFPFAAGIFGGLPDRGFGASKILGLLVFSYAAWILSSLGWAPFTRNTLFVLAAAGTLISLWHRRLSGYTISELWRTRRPLVLASAGACWGAFFLFLCARGFNPEIFWGEKPMDFSFLNTILRATAFPPPEPWFSGTRLSYYYFGTAAFAALGKLTDIRPEFLFNIAIALIPALAAGTAFSVALAMTRRIPPALAATAAVVLLGNLSGPVEHFLRDRPFNFDYFWATSRVIPSTINEYPVWSFLFADLHAHVMSMPFVLLLFLVFVAVFLSDRKGFAIFAEHGGPGTTVVLTALILGVLAATNGWDFLIGSALLFIVFTLHAILGSRDERRVLRDSIREAWFGSTAETSDQPDGGESEKGATFAEWVARGVSASTAAITWMLRAAWFPLATVLLLAIVLFLPYWSQTQFKSVGWGLVHSDQATLGQASLIYGIFLFIYVSLGLLSASGLLTALRGRKIAFTAALPPIVFLLIAAGIVFLQYGFNYVHTVPIACFLLALLFIPIIAVYRSSKPVLLATIFWIAGLAIIGLDEVFFLADRMNTIFKTYIAVWILFAIGAVVYFDALRLQVRSWRITLRMAWAAGVVVLVGVGAFTAVTGAWGILHTHRVPYSEPTLDGMAYLKAGNPDEYGAIEWINDHIPGEPTLLEAQGDSYQNYTRISMNTGLPTVLGWDYHVYQRGNSWDAINRRKADVALLYTTSDISTAQSLLARYDVSYVYVGDMERQRYSAQGLAKFAAFLPEAYRNGRVSIYRVPSERDWTGILAANIPYEIPSGSKVEALPGEAVDPFTGGKGTRPGQFNEPRGIAVDKSGNIYVADTMNHRIQKFSRSGKFLFAWGAQGVGDGEFKEPNGVAVDRKGNVYVADTWNHRIQKFSSKGDFIAKWVPPDRGFYGPRGIAIDKAGFVYVTDSGNHRICKFDSSGKQVAQWGSRGTGDGQFDEPIGITVSPSGEVYVADAKNGRIEVFSSSGRFIRKWSVDGWKVQSGNEPYLEFDHVRLLATDPLGHRVLIYSPTGTLQRTEVVDADNRPLRRPIGVGVGPGQKVVVTLHDDHRVAGLVTVR